MVDNNTLMRLLENTPHTVEDIVNYYYTRYTKEQFLGIMDYLYEHSDEIYNKFFALAEKKQYNINIMKGENN